MYNIGIDLGGTNIAGGICDNSGRLVLKRTIPTLSLRGADLVISDIITLCKSIVEESRLDSADIASVGIGCPGTVNSLCGTIVNAPNVNLINVPIGAMVNDGLNLPVYIENDANCAALSEAMFGAARGSKNSLTVTLGTGIGSGIIIDGYIYSGSFFGAGELGHHVIRMDGEACGCGQRGCWEAYASATALIRDTVSGAKNNPGSIINSLVSGNLDEVTAKTAFDCALAGDSTAIDIVENYLDNLCVGLANIVNMLQPEIIVIGGGISGQGASLIASIEKRVAKRILGGDLKTRFAIAKLGNDAGIIGAAMLSTEALHCSANRL